MEQRELPSNSLMNNKKKEPEKIKPVIDGGASIKKKSFGERFADKFISKDIDNIPRYLMDDVLIPLAKKTVLDTIEILLNGKKSRGSRDGEIVPYNRMNRRNNVYFLGSSSASSSSRKKTFNDLYFDDCAKGEDVWSGINEHLSTYPTLSILQLLELANLEQFSEWTDNNYGWFNMVGMKREYDSKGGMTLKLPPARVLDD